MKNLKRIFSAVLTLVLSFCMISTVSAEGTGKITIKDAEVGKNYEIYKIFDLTLGGTKNDKVAYTIDSDWEAFFNGAGAGYIVNSNEDGEGNPLGLNSITVKGTVKYINITDENVAEFTQAALAYAATLKKVEGEGENQVIISLNDGEQVATSTTVVFDELDLGYYLIYPEGATDIKDGWSSICSIDSTIPKAEVTVKATYPTIDKTVNDYSVEVGQIVEFKITGQVPDTTGFETYTYTISDTMSEGLLFDEDIANLRVYFGEDDETTEVDERTVINDGILNIDNNGFTLTFNMKNHQLYKGQKITVVYNAKVTKDAIDSATTKNSATLTYSNDPKDSSKTTTTPPVVKYLYSADILVIKVDGADNNIKLAGAKFVLKNADGEFYKANYDDNNNLVSIEWVETQGEATEYTTNESGNVTFAGLEDGTYYLVETKAPEGYNLLTQPKEVVVTNEGEATNEEPNIQEITSTVENNSGSALPSTGGMGTTLFIVIGSLLAIVSAVILVTNKRMAKEM